MILSQRMYPHKWLSGANLVARVATIVGTIIWSLIVLKYEVGFTPVNSSLLIFPEDYWGILYLSIGLFSLVHTCKQLPSNHITKFLDLTMAFVWLYTIVGMAIFMPQLPPGGFGACLVMAILSSMNVLALPKERG